VTACVRPVGPASASAARQRATSSRETSEMRPSPAASRICPLVRAAASQRAKNSV
jgi:hypothetical protein